MDDASTALILDDPRCSGVGSPGWTTRRMSPRCARSGEPLALHLEIHAEAEEVILYPHLLKKGGDDADEETDDAIKDHNKIRDAIVESRRHEVGTDEWWKAVWEARRENTEHLAEEERGPAPPSPPRQRRAAHRTG